MNQLLSGKLAFQRISEYVPFCTHFQDCSAFVQRFGQALSFSVQHGNEPFQY
jgi:hypothetical protein